MFKVYLIYSSTLLAPLSLPLCGIWVWSWTRNWHFQNMLRNACAYTNSDTHSLVPESHRTVLSMHYSVVACRIRCISKLHHGLHRSNCTGHHQFNLGSCVPVLSIPGSRFSCYDLQRSFQLELYKTHSFQSSLCTNCSLKLRNFWYTSWSHWHTDVEQEKM